jgi:hypothetical protein
MNAPADIRHQAQIAARYLEHLTMRLRAQERQAIRQSDTDAARTAGTWAERAQELRRYIAEVQL